MIRVSSLDGTRTRGKPRASGDDPLTGRPLRIIDP